MDDFKMPSDELMSEICMDVNAYAVKRCKEAGLPWFCCFLAIERLADAMDLYIAMFELIGGERMSSLAEMVMKANASEVLKEAEDALKGGE